MNRKRLIQSGLDPHVADRLAQQIQRDGGARNRERALEQVKRHTIADEYSEEQLQALAEHVVDVN